MEVKYCFACCTSELNMRNSSLMPSELGFKVMKCYQFIYKTASLVMAKVSHPIMHKTKHNNTLNPEGYITNALR